MLKFYEIRRELRDSISFTDKTLPALRRKNKKSLKNN